MFLISHYGSDIQSRCKMTHHTSSFSVPALSLYTSIGSKEIRTNVDD